MGLLGNYFYFVLFPFNLLKNDISNRNNDLRHVVYKDNSEKNCSYASIEEVQS